MFMLKSGLWETMIATIMAPMQRYLWNAHAGVQGLFTRGKSMEESMNQDMKRALLGDHAPILSAEEMKMLEGMK